MSGASPKNWKVLDEPAALARVGGDVDLLREIAELFQEEYVPAIEALRQAIERGDGPARIEFEGRSYTLE